jgi:hypothetical protein
MRVPPAADAAHEYQVEGGKAQQRLAGRLGARPLAILMQPKASSICLRTFRLA